MPRKVKRAFQRAPKPITQRIRDNPEAWQKELDWWRGLGISTDLLLTSLDGAWAERRIYEKQIQARVDSVTTWEISQAKKAMRLAEPLIHLLKTERTHEEEPFFGDLGDQIVTAVEKYCHGRWGRSRCSRWGKQGQRLVAHLLQGGGGRRR